MTSPASTASSDSAATAGKAGLAVTAVSVAATFTVAVLGPSVMEPALPGRPGQPPWSAAAAPSPYLVVALTAFAIGAGTLGMWLTLRAIRRGWTISPMIILAAGILAAIALALVPPFGSSDHLSYAAYGRMVVTGHDPYTTTPAALARLGDPIARAVQDWRGTPSVYGSVATGGQALASRIGGTSVRLTIFVLSLLNVIAYAVTGLLLHWLARGDRPRQRRAALLWVANPLLLQVLVAGAHVDSQAIVFVVGAAAALALGFRPGSRAGQLGTGGLSSSVRMGCAAALAGGLVGLGFAVKATMALIGAGLAIAVLLAWRDRKEPGPVAGRRALLLLGGLAAGFCIVAGGSLARWGTSALSPALNEGSFVSIGSPWRAVRSAVRLATGEGAAEDLVKWAAVVLAVVLLVLLLRSIRLATPGTWPQAGRLADGGKLGSGQLGSGQPADTPASIEPASRTATSGRTSNGRAWPASRGLDLPRTSRATIIVFLMSVSFAVAFAWLVAWPYVLPWYDGLGWAFLALLPASRLDWLLLARTAGLAIGYLPGRTVTMPANLGWLQSVVRTGVTPLILFAITVTLVVMLWPRRGEGAVTLTGGAAQGSHDSAARSGQGRLA